MIVCSPIIACKDETEKSHTLTHCDLFFDTTIDNQLSIDYKQSHGLVFDYILHRVSKTPRKIITIFREYTSVINKAHPINFSQPCLVTINEDLNVPEQDVLIIARDFIEYSQLDQSQEVLEDAVVRSHKGKKFILNYCSYISQQAINYLF